MYKIQKQKGITLISLVITIVILIILSAVAIYLGIGNNGIFNKAEQAKNETIKQTATEKMNLKITEMQIETYAKEQRMPTLQEFSDGLCEDDEIQYVELQSKKVGSLSKIEVGNASSIFTKLKQYPYEFEINSSLQLASIDGIKFTDSNQSESMEILSKIEETNNINTFNYTGDVQEFIIPENGYYKIECWGAQGGSYSSASGGKGAYAKGIIKLTKDEKLYIYVGECYNGYKETMSFNGGGSGAYGTDGPEINTNGGGATDIRLVNGDWNNFDSLKSRIMVAAGGRRMLLF